MRNIVLTEEQKSCYDAIGKYKSLFITGGAGTGKSEIITSRIKNDIDGNMILCATTNKAAKLLQEKLDTGAKVHTLHSVLGLTPMNDGSTKCVDDLLEFILPADPSKESSLIGMNLIIDEASMICQHVQQYILALLSFNNVDSVTFVGDRYQLACVKGDPFNYELIEKVIELNEVKRAKGDLIEYYNQLRRAVVNDEEMDIYENGICLTDKDEFVEYMQSSGGTKVIITYTNDAAAKFSSLIDGNTIEEGQECHALSHCNYKHMELSESMKIETNSQIKIKKVFMNYEQMERDARRKRYEYYLPNKPIDITLDSIVYAEITNEYDQTGYISVWIGSQKTKEKFLLNKFTREYRKFQDRVKRIVDPSIWSRFAKSDGYVKSLTKVKSFAAIPRHMLDEERIYWNNFFCVNNSITIRSKLVSTAHRAQGMTVDIVGIDCNDLARSKDNKLIYVALTRASKQIVYYIG